MTLSLKNNVLKIVLGMFSTSWRNPQTGSILRRIGQREQVQSVGSYTESAGHYERVPIRIGDFSLVTNEEGLVVFETTAEDICGSFKKIKIHITNHDGWHVEIRRGGALSVLTPSVDLTTERLARRRAFWHAIQFMIGRDLSHKQRFSLMHTAGDAENTDLFKDDAFFENGDEVTADPFGPYLES